MIAKIILPGTDLTVSRLTFGTSRLFSAGGRANRYAVIEAAARIGFTHFDTAPSYGFGMAERDLGDVLGGDNSVTITTKTGLYSPGGEDQPWASIFARKLLGRGFPTLSAPIADWSVDRAKRSLDASLKRLKRDRIDILLMHEAELPLLNADEWLGWMDAERKTRVRFFGVAVGGDRLPPILLAPEPMLEIIQTEDSLAQHEADPLLKAGRQLQLTYGYLSSLSDADRSEAGVAATIRGALERNTQGSVLVSTTTASRIPALASAAMG